MEGRAVFFRQSVQAWQLCQGASAGAGVKGGILSHIFLPLDL